MKKIFLIIPTLLLTSVSLLAQTPNSASDKNASPKATDGTIKIDTPFEKVGTGIAKVQFKEKVHNFGNVPQNIPATCVFEFTNTGTEIISVQDASASCGCTKPVFSAEPVAVGKIGKITAAYNAAVAGNFTKTITVKFSNGDTELLTITGNVEIPPAAVPSPVEVPKGN